MFTTPPPHQQETPKAPRATIGEQKEEQKKKEVLKKMEDQMKVLIYQRGAVRGKLARVKIAIEHSEDDPNPNIGNLHFLQLHRKAVDQCYREYNDFQNSIYALPLSDKIRDDEMERFVDFETMYNDVAIKLSMLIEKAEKAAALTAVPPPAPTAVALQRPLQPFVVPGQPYLPPLQVPLPTFDGSYEKWFSFKSMFTTVMNRYQREEPALKLYHLRNCLVGRAAGIIDQDIVNNNDYDAAWKVLEQRYEDKRVIIDKHIENLFNLPKIGHENAANMRKMIDTCTKNVEALKNQNLPTDGLGEQMVVNLIATKMEKKMRIAWETRQKKGNLPTYAATLEFLQEQCRIYEKVDSKMLTESAKSNSVLESHTLVTSEKKELKCPVCDIMNHELWRCDSFKSLSVSERYNVLKRCGGCFNCLARGHRTSACSSTHFCRECGQKHHSLLHSGDTSDASETATGEEPETGDQAGTSTTLCASVESPDKQILLSTAVVKAHGLCSTLYPCRVLLDSASQTNFVTERFANLLSTNTDPADYTVSGLNGNRTKVHRMLRTTIESCHGDFRTELELLVTPLITGDLPVNSFDVADWPIAEREMADPTFYERGRVDMLIGAEFFWELLKIERVNLGPNLPTLMDTKLGWIAGGVIASDTPVVARVFCHTAYDEIRPTGKAEDERCLELFRHTEEAYELQREAEGLLKRACLGAQKWRANHDDVPSRREQGLQAGSDGDLLATLDQEMD